MAVVEQIVLSVTLKDLATSNSDASTAGTFGLGKDGDDDEEDGVVRAQYRVLKKDLLFKVNFL